MTKITDPVKRERIETWCKLLESGEFMQGTHSLRTASSTYCCLAVGICQMQRDVPDMFRSDWTRMPDTEDNRSVNDRDYYIDMWYAEDAGDEARTQGARWDDVAKRYYQRCSGAPAQDVWQEYFGFAVFDQIFTVPDHKGGVIRDIGLMTANDSHNATFPEIAQAIREALL